MYHQGFSESSRIYGKITIGRDSFISQGAILRSHHNSITIGNHTGILENCVVVGTSDAEVHIGSKTVFGHSCIVLGATIGDLCEVGNNTLVMPGAKVGDRCIFGEATIVPENKTIPNNSVVVGRPGKIIRQLNDSDLQMIKRMRNNDMAIEAYIEKIVENEYEGGHMGTLHPFKDQLPVVGQSSIIYDTAEITGDVTIGNNCIIGSGVKIIGDSHGPVIIGDHVQILENTVLHLLPGNQLIIKDHTIIGPGSVVHGTIIEKGCVIESNVTLCDNSHIGENSIIKAGSLIKQHTTIEENSIVEGFPAKVIAKVDGMVTKPMWAFK